MVTILDCIRRVPSLLDAIRLSRAQAMEEVLSVCPAQNISEICYACGFNNLSNFNRIFKAKRGMSPREFRQIYKKTKVIV